MRYPNKKTLLRCLLLAVVLSPGACKPPKSSGLSAIVSQDGQNATGLLAIRQKFVFGVDVSDGEASMVQDAMRLTYGAAECVGSKSALVFNFMEDVTRYSVAGLKREGRDILIPIRSFEETMNYGKNASYFAGVIDQLEPVGLDYKKVKNCSIKGDGTLSAGSFVSLMTDPTVSFETKQIIWLAARGRATGSKVFSKAFYTFLRENLGASTIGTKAQSVKTLKRIDSQFNPCVNNDEKVVKNFVCDENKNYRVTGSYSTVLNKFLATVDAQNKEYLKVLANYGPAGMHSVRGLEVAASASASIAKSGIIGSVSMRAVKAPMPERGAENKVHPMIAVMLPSLERVQEYFHVVVGTQPGQVLDSENPVTIVASPASTSDSLGLTGQSGLAALSDQFDGPEELDEEGGFGLIEETPPAAAGGATPVPTGSTATPATSPVQTGEVPLIAQNISPANNLSYDQAPAGTWNRGTGADINVFTRTDATTGLRYESRAELSADNKWVYNTRAFDPTKNNAVVDQKIMFRHDNTVAGGAGANTFVSYDVPPGQVSTNWKDRSQYTGAGSILTAGANGANPQWLDFQPAASGGTNPTLNASTRVVMPGTDVRGGGSTYNVKPYTFGSGSDVRYLGNAQGSNELSWITPGKPEATPVQATPSRTLPPAVAATVPVVTATPTQTQTETPAQVQARVEAQVTDPVAVSALRLAEAQQREVAVAAEQERTVKALPTPETPGAVSTQRELKGALEELKQVTTETKVRAQEGPTTQTATRVAQDQTRLEEARLKVDIAQRDATGASGSTNAGQRATQERNLAIKDQEKVLQTMNSPKPELTPAENAAALVQSQIDAEARRLQAAKIDRENFIEKNGQPWSSQVPSSRRGWIWNPPYDNPANQTYYQYDTTQKQQLELLHAGVRESETKLRRLEEQRQMITNERNAILMRAQTATAK